MNIIQRQADTFFEWYIHDHTNTKEAVDKTRYQLLEYNKVPHRIEFLEHIIQKTKVDYDEHYAICEETKKGQPCNKNRYYEDVLFFLNNELDELKEQLSPQEFTDFEKIEQSKILATIVEDLKTTIILSNQNTYELLAEELQDLKSYYYLDKKRWSQLFLGKITDWTAGGMVSETVSKSLVEFVKSHLPQ